MLNDKEQAEMEWKLWAIAQNIKKATEEWHPILLATLKADGIECPSSN